MTAPRLLLWCLAGAALVQLILSRAGTGNPLGFAPAFWYLLSAYDTHGNVLLCALAAGAFALRRQPSVLGAVRYATDRPWTIAAWMFLLLCAGSIRVYHDHPLSMDEYSAVFQARAFAAGKLSGALPPDLLDRLVPPFFQNYFFSVSRSSGEISSRYWPSFALLLAPFAWLDIPWALNPAIGALTLPALHRLTQQVTGSREAAGWAIALTAASPVFIVSSISYYSMPAHLLCNLLYAMLLLRPSVPRALLAGIVGSVALTLHQPAPHLLFCLPFLAWLLVRRKSLPVLGALALGYLPLGLLLGVGWHDHLLELARGAQSAAPALSGPAVVDSLGTTIGAAITFPRTVTIEARIAGLSKVWTWGALGLMVLAASGYWSARARTEVRLLGAALATTFFGYFLVTSDQGHGWGYRYLHSAWFVLPVFASIALSGAPGTRPGAELRAMAAWGTALSLALANALRLVQVEAFMDRHLAQVPPLTRSADRAHPELVFIDIRSGFYTQDLVQNDPFLRAPRVVMMSGGPASDAALAARRFPGYVKSAEGTWGESWRAGR